MSQFELYLRLGFDHISDINAYDHILFIVALCAVYAIKNWKKVLILVTAFTVGHSITLALAILDIVKFPERTIEMLIPITIMLTCLYNILYESREGVEQKWKYFIAIFFGLIHGMGFSSFLRMILGEEESIIEPLFAFNIGLELGQIGIVIGALAITFIVVDRVGVEQKKWNIIVSVGTFLIALKLFIDLF